MSRYEDDNICELYEDWPPPWICTACEDQGWMMGPDGLVIPCTECSQELEMKDLG